MAGRNAPYQIAIAKRQRAVSLDVRQLRRAAEETLLHEQVVRAEISIALVGDPEIWRVNKQFLNHDYPTDVVSFLLEVTGKTLCGEIVIGVEYARREAAVYRWPVQHEVILYLVHGLLHLCGYDDLSPKEKRIMRRRENAILKSCGIDRVPRRRPRSASGHR